MHVMDEVRRDPDKVGQLPALEIDAELGKGNHLVAAARVGTNVLKVQKRVMPEHVVVSLRAEKTRLGEILLVTLPALAFGFQFVNQVRLIDKAVRAIGADAEGITPEQGQIIRQTGVGNGIVVIGNSVLVC